MIISCQDSLVRSKKYSTIIVDNASSDRSAEKLRRHFDGIQIEALEKNIGYGRAANVGLRMVQTPYALLLNPDILATPEDVIRLLTHAVGDKCAAIWGPVAGTEELEDSPPEAVEWIRGCAMLFDVAKIRAVGLFDEEIFLFFEETDLCTRVISSGYEIKLCKDVLFEHLLGRSCVSNPAIEYMKGWHYGWSRCYYFDKHMPNIKKRTPERQYFQYRLKALTAIGPEKRCRYKAQADGAKAFLVGEKAFLGDGSPQALPN
jgi:GT2 family glycosyltransferase